MREVVDDARDRLVDNVVGHLLNGVTEPALEYWADSGENIGKGIADGVRAKAKEKDPQAAEQGNPARRTMQHKA
ncbi:hypothetical protein GCM10027162_12430 [Streptomyces incanus]